MVYNCLPHFWSGLLPERDDDVEIFDEIDEIEETENWEEDDDLDEMM